MIMKYLMLALLLSAIIIGNVAGESRQEELERMVRDAESVKHNVEKRQKVHRCVYRPPPRPRPRPPVWV